MRIPDEKIDEIRTRVDIVDLIGGFIPLKKRGKNYIGLCPFHAEKTPSFNVSPERQMYHCFGCGVGGNAFTFIMEYDKVSFVEAVRTLAERVGVFLSLTSPEEDARASEQEELYAVCREAGLFYYHSLTESPEGKFAHDYFHQRGFTEETIRTFGLGYSPNSWDALLRHGEGKGISPTLLEKAGLARRREDGSYHDYFRGRAMFPIFSTTGRAVGFGGRKLREDDPLGKYINSPETLIYSKSKILYGLFQAKDDIREKDFVILVEGYADFLSVFQAGVRNIVASSGTALTAEQIELLSRYTKNITIIYDADSAGSKAALRGVDLILEHDLDVRVAALPEGDDPDSFIRKVGGAAFRSLADRAVSFIDFISQAYERQGGFSTPEGQARTVRVIVQTIAKMSDELKRNFYIKQLAEKYKLYESTLHRELEKSIEHQRHSPAEISRGAPPLRPGGVSDAPHSLPEEVPAVEGNLLRAMVEGGSGVVELVVRHLTPSHFTNQRARTLFTLLTARAQSGATVDPGMMINESHDPSMRKFIAQLLFSRYQLSRGWEEGTKGTTQGDPKKIALDAIVLVKRRALEKLKRENQLRLKEASRRGEDILPLLERNNELIKLLQELETKGAEGEE